MEPNQMTARELGSFLPNMMPEGQVLSVGDHVLVRLMRQRQVIRRASILDIFEPVESMHITSITLNRASAENICIKVYFEDDFTLQQPIWPVQDFIYTYGWVNDYAGYEVVLPPEGASTPSQNLPRKETEKIGRFASRFKKLLDN